MSKGDFPPPKMIKLKTLLLGVTLLCFEDSWFDFPKVKIF